MRYTGQPTPVVVATTLLPPAIQNFAILGEVAIRLLRSRTLPLLLRRQLFSFVRCGFVFRLLFLSLFSLNLSYSWGHSALLQTQRAPNTMCVFRDIRFLSFRQDYTTIPIKKTFRYQSPFICRRGRFFIFTNGRYFAFHFPFLIDICDILTRSTLIFTRRPSSPRYSSYRDTRPPWQYVLVALPFRPWGVLSDCSRIATAI